MRGKKYLVAAILISSVSVLSACGEGLPEMTEEEYNQTVEYAAGVLLKHSNNDKSRLVFVDPDIVAKEREVKAERDAQRAANLEEITAKQQAAAEEEERLREEEERERQEKLEERMEEASGHGSNGDESDDESSDASSIDSSSKDQSGSEDSSESGKSSDDDEQESNTGKGSSKSGSGSAGSTITVTSDDSQEIQNNIFISYDGYSISSHYPESSKSYVINADKGKKLLVLRFDLYNAASTSQEVNMYKKNLMFQVYVNGVNLGYSAVTVLPNDLSSYMGSVDSKAHESLVLLVQIKADDATSIETIELKASMDGKEQTVNLR